MLARGEDGILIEYSTVQDHPGMWQELLRRAEEELPQVIEDALRREQESQ
jgi:hypothetical protein